MSRIGWAHPPVRRTCSCQLQRTTGSGFRPGERVEITSAGIVPADSEVADALEVEEGASVVQRRRRYLDEDGVIALSTSWLPGELAEAAPELIVTGPLPKMTFGLIEDRTGRRAVDRAGGHESSTAERGLRSGRCLRRGIGRHRDGGGTVADRGPVVACAGAPIPSTADPGRAEQTRHLASRPFVQWRAPPGRQAPRLLHGVWVDGGRDGSWGEWWVRKWAAN
ncbi:UTRA domain-containing protein [Streptomyces griseoluteus]|uniref:UTRA domain-containing protein n=1 Tax=Streptomyces griseoluteus TaxID=29306 RepID=UPI0037007AF4